MSALIKSQTAIAATKKGNLWPLAFITRNAKKCMESFRINKEKRLNHGKIARSKAKIEKKDNALLSVLSTTKTKDPEVKNSKKKTDNNNDDGGNCQTSSINTRYSLRSNSSMASVLLTDTQELSPAKSTKRKRSDYSVPSTTPPVTRSTPAPSQPPPKQVLVECIACRDPVPEKQVIETDCKHNYCRPCLRTLLLLATKTEALFPPRCCTTNGVDIPLDAIRAVFSTGEMRSYRLTEREYATPSDERLYCPKATCGRFIRLPDGIKPGLTWGLVHCSRCRTEVCFGCKTFFHLDGKDCVTGNDDLEKVLSLADGEKWRRCPKCRNMVERTAGCRSMYCRCGTHFCYDCGRLYKSCSGVHT